ncbi:MAG: serine/threonine protein kinase [Myxococcaceae bacterium]|nr:serine/threonine protein kinase [Myxococcaceae bacterium]
MRFARRAGGEARYTWQVAEERVGKPPVPPGEEATQSFPLVAPPSGSMRAAPTAGDRVGKYVIDSILGRGGMGIVVAARHEGAGREELVAIKLLHPKAAKDAVQVERFVREARSTVRIKSEHVVRVLDAGAEEATGSPFIVMEFLQGRDIAYVLANFGPMPPQTAVDYIIQICEATAAAHALGIVHRDLKPSNFFLTHRPDGTALVKVLDFGISKAAQLDGMPDPRLTETQAVFGSPTYMSPEQIRSSKNVDQRSDIWSLGVALFEMLTRKLPFVADNVAGLLASVIADPPFTVSYFRPDVPPGLEAIVLACLEKDAARRIGSAGELARRLIPYASPAGAELAARVQEVPSPSGSSPNVAPQRPPMPSARPSSPSSPSAHSALSPSSPSWMPSPPASIPGPPVSFGTTHTDLSATGPDAFHASVRRGTGRSLAIVAATLVTVAAFAGIFFFAKGSSGSRAAGAQSEAGPPEATSATLPPPTSAATAAGTATTVPSAGSALTADGTPIPGGSGSAAPKIRRPKSGAGRGPKTGAGAPDLDSRF